MIPENRIACWLYLLVSANLINEGLVGIRANGYINLVFLNWTIKDLSSFYEKGGGGVIFGTR